MKFQNNIESNLWAEVYIANVRAGKAHEHAKYHADQAVEAWRERS